MMDEVIQQDFKVSVDLCMIQCTHTSREGLALSGNIKEEENVARGVGDAKKF